MDTDVGSVPIAALYLQPPKSLHRKSSRDLISNYVKSRYTFYYNSIEHHRSHFAYVSFRYTDKEKLEPFDLAPVLKLEACISLSLSLGKRIGTMSITAACRPAVAAARLGYIHISEEQNEISKWEITFVRRGTGTKRCPGHQ